MDDERVVGILETALGAAGRYLGDLIVHAEEPYLRCFAHACADYAVTVCGLTDEHLHEALRATAVFPTLLSSDQTIEQVRHDVEGIVASLDHAAFVAQEAADNGKASYEGYSTAFRRARAATSVLRCLDPSARFAAMEACYEAFYAANDANALVNIGKHTLDKHTAK